MLNIAFKGAALLRTSSLVLFPLVCAKNLAISLKEQMGLMRKTFLHDQGAAYFEEIAEVQERNDVDNEQGKTDSLVADKKNEVAIQAMQLALFGYTSYRVLSGEESPMDFALSCSATALMLYPHAKKATQKLMQSDTVEQATKIVFQKAKFT